MRPVSPRLVARPCAHMLQIQAAEPRRVQPNAVLERLYQARAVQVHTVTHDDMFPKCSRTFYGSARRECGQQVIYRNCVSSLESGHEATGGTLQTAGLGRTENPKMVSRPPEPRQAQHADQVLREHVGPDEAASCQCSRRVR